MDLLIAANSVPLSLADGPPSTGTPQYASDGVPGTQAATVFPAYIFNAVMKELIALIQGAGLTPDRNNNAQVIAAIRALIAASAYVPPTGVVVLNNFSSVYSYSSATGNNYFVKTNPNGDIVQGGQVTGTNASGTTLISVTFPIPFPSGQAPVIGLTLSNLSASPAGASYISSRSSTGFTAVLAGEYGFYWRAEWK